MSRLLSPLLLSITLSLGVPSSGIAKPSDTQRELSKAQVTKTLKWGLKTQEAPYTKRLGLLPFTTINQLKESIKNKVLVRVPDSGDGYYLSPVQIGESLEKLDMSEDQKNAAIEAYKHTRPEARIYLLDLGKRFRTQFPKSRFEISSVTRTIAYQKILQGDNPNAAKGFAPHTYGIALDIRRASLSPEEDTWLAQTLAQDELKGKIFATRERVTNCYHFVPIKREPLKSQKKRV